MKRASATYYGLDGTITVIEATGNTADEAIINLGGIGIIDSFVGLMDGFNHIAVWES